MASAVLISCALLFAHAHGLQVLDTSCPSWCQQNNSSEFLRCRWPFCNTFIQKPHKPTFGILVRVYRNELPYIASFIRHYSRLGVNKFHILCTWIDQLAEVNKYLKFEADLGGLPQDALNIVPYGDVKWGCISSMHAGDPGCPANSKDIFNSIKEDYLLPIDPDEFLTLPDGMHSLGDLVKSYDQTVLFTFRWVLVPYDRQGKGPRLPYRGYAGTCDKYMVRRTAIKKLSTHEVEMDCTEKCEETDLGPTMLHFHYRGIVDSALKDSAEKFKSDGMSRFLKDLKHGEPGLRMKLLAFSSIVAEIFGPSIMQPMRLLEIDKNMEEKVFASLGIPLTDVAAVYKKFKRQLRNPVNWARFAYLAGKAPVVYEDVMMNTSLSDLKRYSRNRIRRTRRAKSLRRRRKAV